MGDDRLEAVLADQRRRDLIGPGSWDDLIAHALGYTALVDEVPVRVVDLGSGGGLPGLVLAARVWPAARWTLLDASQRRCTALELCVAELGIGDRVEVRWDRAEDAGRDPDLRGRADLVVARRFAGVAVTAECAAPLLRPGGGLVVSEPPASRDDRWPPEGLAILGLARRASTTVGRSSYTRLDQLTLCPDLFPRRAGVPARRPLF